MQQLSRDNYWSRDCGGRRTRTVVADETTRPCERRRPVPTGNILQTQPNLATVSSSATEDNPSKVSIARNGKWLAAAHFSKSARSGAPPVSLVSDMNCAKTGATRLFRQPAQTRSQ